MLSGLVAAAAFAFLGPSLASAQRLGDYMGRSRVGASSLGEGSSLGTGGGPWLWSPPKAEDAAASTVAPAAASSSAQVAPVAQPQQMFGSAGAYPGSYVTFGYGLGNNFPGIGIVGAASAQANFGYVPSFGITQAGVVVGGARLSLPNSGVRNLGPSLGCSAASAPCSCADIPGCGWSQARGACEAGKETDCEECPEQTGCRILPVPCAAGASSPCDCSTLFGCGWDTPSGSCEENQETDCGECPERARCPRVPARAGTGPVGQDTTTRPPAFPPAVLDGDFGANFAELDFGENSAELDFEEADFGEGDEETYLGEGSDESAPRLAGPLPPGLESKGPLPPPGPAKTQGPLPPSVVLVTCLVDIPVDCR